MPKKSFSFIDKTLLRDWKIPKKVWTLRRGQSIPRSYCVRCNIPVYTNEEQINEQIKKYKNNHKCLNHKLILKHWVPNSKNKCKPGIDFNKENFFKLFLLVKFNVLVVFGTWICFDCLEQICNNDKMHFFLQKNTSRFFEIETEKRLISQLLNSTIKQNLQVYKTVFQKNLFFCF